jgi:hypothetical protein
VKVPSALTTTEPLAVVTDPAKVIPSPSTSPPTTAPMTTPVFTSRGPMVALPVGAVFFGLITTVTGTARMPPWPSSTLTVNVSVLSMPAAAVCRASGVGV